MINGLREIGRALDGGLNVQEFYFCPELCESEAARGVLSRLKLTAAAAPFEVSESVFSLLAYGSRMDGIVAVAEIPRHDLKALRLPERALVAVLEKIEKPGNVGAVVRSATRQVWRR